MVLNNQRSKVQGWSIQQLSLFIIIIIIYYSHPSGWEVVSHCGF